MTDIQEFVLSFTLMPGQDLKDNSMEMLMPCEADYHIPSYEKWLQIVAGVTNFYFRHSPKNIDGLNTHTFESHELMTTRNQFVMTYGRNIDWPSTQE